MNLNHKTLASIQKLFNSDIRSMINFMQSNQDIVKKLSTDTEPTNETIGFNIIDNDIWESIIKKISDRDDIESICSYIYSISTKYNIDKKNIIKDFLNYIIRNNPKIVTSEFLNFVENLMHSQNINNNSHIYYSISRLASFI